MGDSTISKPRFTGIDVLEIHEGYDEEFGPFTQLVPQPEVVFPDNGFFNYVPTNGTVH